MPMTSDTSALSPQVLWALGWGLCAASMLIAWARQRTTLDATSVDLVWTLNLGLLGAGFAAFGSGAPARRGLLALLVAAWCARLALHLARTRLLAPGHVEDRRYAGLREAWGVRAQRNFFWLYQAQALLDALLSIPFLLVAFDRDAGLGAIEIAAVLLLAASLLGEHVADRQLARFKSDPANRGRTCRAGLWRYSRHPNYFFEWLAWCAFALLALGAPSGWQGLSAPALMLLLLLKVTGVPPAEAQALRTRGSDYREYQRTTSAFFPWIPARSPA